MNKNTQMIIWIYRMFVVMLIVLMSWWLLQRHVTSQLLPLLAFTENQKMEIINMLSLIHEDGTDISDESKVFKNFLSNCDRSELVDYETTLSGLNEGLTQLEIIELRVWFDRCGKLTSKRDFYTFISIKDLVHTLHVIIEYQEVILDLLNKPELDIIYIDTDLLSDWVQKWEGYVTLQFQLDELQRKNLELAFEGETVTSSVVVETSQKVYNIKNKILSKKASKKELFTQIINANK